MRKIGKNVGKSGDSSFPRTLYFALSSPLRSRETKREVRQRPLQLSEMTLVPFGKYALLARYLLNRATSTTVKPVVMPFVLLQRRF